uniref:ATP synthase complex subunit 8 n=1 Tax=Nemoptera coa TaxID=560912 RepID=A0A1S5QYD6_9NEOP|nr:ATP synthase F0 subunit 8 [Nemoptera coa]WRK67315.1 ATP synthase F0 subunit 8 [Nemoptera coa]
MPQMSPLSWWVLFLFFVMMLIIMCIMNYFITIYKPIYSNKIKNFEKPFLHWKW